MISLQRIVEIEADRTAMGVELDRIRNSRIAAHSKSLESCDLGVRVIQPREDIDG